MTVLSDTSLILKCSDFGLIKFHDIDNQGSVDNFASSQF